MSGRIEARLGELNIALPTPAPAQGSYVPWVRAGSLLFVSGQVTHGSNGLEYVGALGREFGVEEGKAAARLAALNVIAQAKSALDGDLDRVSRVVKVTGFVNAVPGFAQHPEVVNGASDLFTQIFGDKGRHARAAVGCSSLPRNVAVEIEATFEIA
ncbi:MAG TPA: RidA family protein [Micropepsaceae bacterium]|nr:RidA family protein [Micropepsaceae bacterium]